jgi:hypothetical protein
VDKIGGGAVAKGKEKKLKVVQRQGTKRDKHGLATGDVQEGYGRDHRGVIPSEGRPWSALKQALDPPTHPKKGQLGEG